MSAKWLEKKPKVLYNEACLFRIYPIYWENSEKGRKSLDDFFKSYIFKMCDVSKFFKVATNTDNGSNC